MSGPTSAAARRSERGIALVITLILLSVTLVMALAFLAVSQREGTAVTTNTATITARLAADSALAQAEAQVIASALATSNAFNYGLLVSTNFISGAGYDTSVGANPTNVNYNYPNGSQITGGDFLQNLANLQYSPRPPVFIITNRATGATEFRFYLDLNRNGSFDDSGWITNLDNNLNGLGSTNFQMGDPQWIGVLERPDAPHGPNNKFLARYAFVALPVGNGLDLNYIHDQTLNQSLGTSDGFFRNEGVGTWEINLAAFLADLNTNQWLPAAPPNNGYYAYNRAGNSANANSGIAFDDARSLLSYRYNGNYNTLAFGSPGFLNDGIDEYADGSLMTGTVLPFDNDSTTYWAGSDNANHFFTPSDFFDRTKITAPSLNFIDRLSAAGTNASTYDRYTFYRLLAQLGTDSQPESGKMNLNYDNLDRGLNGALNINGTASATNFVPWTAINFFTNAADRMLKLYSADWFKNGPSNYLATYYGVITNYNDPTGFGLTNFPYFGVTNSVPAFGIANIPVLVNGNFIYRPAVQRVLQLAANIYDASTNKAAVLGKDYPSVFRPTFVRVNENGYANVYINGYQDVSAYSATATLNAGTAPLDPPVDVTLLPLGYTPSNPSLFGQTGGNVYGVPWIIGAKKGFPNFNKFTMQNVVQVERKVELTRQSITDKPSTFQTNQMFIMSVSNSIAVEFWNSYNSNYVSSPGGIKVSVSDKISMALTNNAGGNSQTLQILNPMPYYVATNAAAFTVWPGSGPWDFINGQPQPGSFVVPLNTTIVLLTNSAYDFAKVQFTPTSLNDSNFFNTTTSPLPQFGLLTTNQLQVFVLDGNHVIDYVHLNGPNSSRNLNNEIADVTANGSGLWHTNRGIYNQIIYSDNPQVNKQTAISTNDDSTWKNDVNGHTAGFSIAYFDAFFHNGSHIGSGTDPNTGTYYTATNLDLQAQVPFTPSRIAYDFTSWQANDPLVHYLASDLNFSAQDSIPQPGVNQWNSSASAFPQPAFTALNERYQPWGRIRLHENVDANAYNLAYKDPLLWQSDDWDFPANKLPGIGWLGRVHRGTPWQTVYLKATNILSLANSGASGLATWTNWSSDFNTFDAINMGPTQDHLLFDVFTTAPNDNATRGQLSVNIGAPDGPSLAAWSALFSGVVVLTNTAVTPGAGAAPAYTNLVIDPAGVNGTNSPLWQLANAINQRRATFTNTDGVPHTFEHVGNLLATPQLTEQSPFLNQSSAAQVQNGISDEMYEWLPQQTLSLLRASGAPRYVIYCYGQTLRPAPGSILTGGNFFGMCTNYQVVAETATRVVCHVVYDAGDTTKTHPHIVVDSFNVLPPD